MADPPPDPDSGDDTGVEPDRGATTGPPLWVKVFGVIALVVVLLFVVLLVIGGGHGPGRHTQPGDPAAHTAPFSVTEHGLQQP